MDIKTNLCWCVEAADAITECKGSTDDAGKDGQIECAAAFLKEYGIST